jgi:phage gpG-like protein
VEGKPYQLETGWLKGEDPLVAAEQVDFLDHELMTFAKPLIAARRVVADDVKRHFDSESDPDGKSWPPWSDSYARRAASRGQEKMLQLTGALYSAATNPSSYEIISPGVSMAAVGGGAIALIGSALPDYWVFHDQPEQPNTGKIPQRKFMGISDQATAEIDSIFEAWFDATLVGVVRRTGQPIVRTAAGPRFASYFHDLGD